MSYRSSPSFAIGGAADVERDRPKDLGTIVTPGVGVVIRFEEGGETRLSEVFPTIAAAWAWWGRKLIELREAGTG